MKRALTLLVVAGLFLLATSSLNRAQAQHISGTVPLYRYYNPSYNVRDHFYTINFDTLGDGAHGWHFENEECYVFPPDAPGSGTVPLYRYWNPVAGDHFYTINYDTLGEGANGWTLENVECYVYDYQATGSVPLYRYWHANNADHFYTIDFNALGYGGGGWTYEGIECYVSP